MNEIENLLIHVQEHNIFKGHTTLIGKAWRALEKAKSRLSAAIEYEILPEAVKNGRTVGPITIRRQIQRNWIVKWAVYHHGRLVLDRDGDWQMEPIPSNRTDEFLQATRFDFEEAWERAEKAAEQEQSRAMYPDDLVDRRKR